MKIIGLCGGSGSGKGAVSAIFAEIGLVCLDTDKVYHEIISTDSECTIELIEAFGEKVHAHPGIDRRALREIVFSSNEKRLRLNAIAHKHVINAVKKTISESKNAPGFIIDAPLLFESRLNEICDVTLCVIADDDARLARIVARDGLTVDEAKARIAAQIPNEVLIEKCTYSIENNSDIDSLRDNVLQLKSLIFDN